MNSKDFVIWLRGFSASANSYNITPKQWEDLQGQLAQVNLDEEETLEGSQFSDFSFSYWTSTSTLDY